MTETTQLSYTNQETYDYLLRSFNRSCEGKPVDFQEIRNYFIALKHRGVSSSYISLLKCAIKKSFGITFPERMKDADFRSDLESLLRGIRCGSTEKQWHYEDVLTQEEIERLISCKPSKKTAVPNLVVHCLAKTGVRVSELAGIRLSDCRIENDTVIVLVHGKGYRSRRIFLSTTLYHKLRTEFQGKTFLLENRNGNRYCRKFLWKKVKEYGREILNRKISNHTFRRSFATFHLCQRQKSLKSISKYLGHSSITTTCLYIVDEMKYSDLFQEAL